MAKKFLNLLLMGKKNLSFEKDSAKLKKYLQKDLFEQRSCIFIIFCSRRAQHFGQSPVLGYFPNLTIFYVRIWVCNFSFGR